MNCNTTHYRANSSSVPGDPTARPNAAPFYTQVVTGSGGDAEMKIDVDESALPDSAVLVQANYSGRTATRKFQLRKVEA